MNSQAYRSSAPALYQTVFKSRFANEPIDAEMFDIIKANAYVDAARIFHSVFENSYTWRGTPVGVFRSAINLNSTTWMSEIEAIEDNINMMFENISSSRT